MEIGERRKVARETDVGVVSGKRNFIAIDEDEDKDKDEDEEGPVDENEAANTDAADGGDILQVGIKEEFQKIEIDSFMCKPSWMCVEDF
eukprot:6548004-Ditylum_brightwellii.AAC.1